MRFVFTLFIRSIFQFFSSSNLFRGHFVTCMHWSCTFLPTEARWSTTKDGLLLVGSPRRSFGCSHAFVVTEYEMCVISARPWLLMHRLISQLLPMVLTRFWTTTTQPTSDSSDYGKNTPPSSTLDSTSTNFTIGSITRYAPTGLVVSVIPFTPSCVIFCTILPPV